MALAAPVTYDNKYEIYGGDQLHELHGGQELPKRMNMGGGEVLGTYWLKPRSLGSCGRGVSRRGGHDAGACGESLMSRTGRWFI